MSGGWVESKGGLRAPFAAEEHERMKIDTTTNYPEHWPALMTRLTDQAIMLVARIEDPTNGHRDFHFTNLSDGSGYYDTMHESRYAKLPVGFQVTITN